MSRGQPQPLDFLGWIVWPVLMCLAATLLLATPVRLWGLRAPEPVWLMIPAFAWPVIRPSVVAPFVLLLSGLTLDLFWGTALGQWSLALIAVYGAVLALRHLMVGQSGAVLWAWYLGLTALAFALAHMIAVIDVGGRPAPASVGLQALVTALLYPFAHRLIDRYEDAGARVR